MVELKVYAMYDHNVFSNDKMGGKVSHKQPQWLLILLVIQLRQYDIGHSIMFHQYMKYLV